MAETNFAVSIDTPRNPDTFVPTEQLVRDEYYLINRSFKSFFGESIPDGFVKGIRWQNKSKGGKETAAAWVPKSQALYMGIGWPEADESNWGVTAAHELGHAFHQSKDPKNIYDANTVVQESFANLCAIVHSKNGFKEDVSRSLARGLRAESILFAPERITSYTNVTGEDTAVLNYFVQNFGLDKTIQLLELAPKVPYYYPSFMDKVLKRDVGGENQARAQQAFETFDQGVQGLFGKSVKELTQDAYDWYDQYRKFNAAQPKPKGYGRRRNNSEI